MAENGRRVRGDNTLSKVKSTQTVLTNCDMSLSDSSLNPHTLGHTLLSLSSGQYDVEGV